MRRKTRLHFKKLVKRRKTRKQKTQRGGRTEPPVELTPDEKRTKMLATDIIKGLKEEGMFERPIETIKTTKEEEIQPRPDTVSSNRPTGMIEQILLAPVRIPGKLLKLPLKMMKSPFKALKRMVF